MAPPTPTLAQRTVKVTVAHKANSCTTDANGDPAPNNYTPTAPQGNPYTLTPAGTSGASTQSVIGTASCVWTISYQNTAADCAVSATLKDTRGNTIASDDTTDGEFEISTRERAASSNPVATIEFAVGACYTTFEATINVTVSDSVNNANHSGTEIPVTITPIASASSVCAALPEGGNTVTLTLGANGAANNEASQMVTLVDTPSGGGTPCEYDVSGTTPVTSAANVELRRTAVDTVSPSDASATVTYAAYRPITLGLTNFTSTQGLGSTTTEQRNVVVTINAKNGSSQDCIDAQPASSFTLIANNPTGQGTAAATAELGNADCTWVVNFRNTNSDCRLLAQRRGPDGQVNNPVYGGSIEVNTRSGQVSWPDPIPSEPDEVVTSIEIQIDGTNSRRPYCSTYFPATFDVTVNDALSGNHANNSVDIAVAKASGAHDRCSDDVTVSVSIGAPTGMESTGSRDHTLVNVPYPDDPSSPAPACTYTATFADVTTTGNVLLEDTGTEAATFSAASATVSRTFEADRDLSEEPTLTLTTASDTGNDDGPDTYYTKTMEPTFNVAFGTAVNGTTVTVSATRTKDDGTTETISQEKTSSNASSIDFAFVGVDKCTKDGSAAEDQSCALNDGTWTVTVTHTDSAKEGPSTDTITVVVVNTFAPTFTIRDPVPVTLSGPQAVGSIDDIRSLLPFLSSDGRSTRTNANPPTATLAFTAGATSGLTAANLNSKFTQTGQGTLSDWTEDPSNPGTFTATFTPPASGIPLDAFTVTGLARAYSGFHRTTFELAANALPDLAGNQNPASSVHLELGLQDRAVARSGLDSKGTGFRFHHASDAGFASDSKYNVTVTPKSTSSACRGRANMPDSLPYTLRAGETVFVSLAGDVGCSWRFEFGFVNPSAECRSLAMQFKGVTRVNNLVSETEVNVGAPATTSPFPATSSSNNLAVNTTEAQITLDVGGTQTRSSVTGVDFVVGCTTYIDPATVEIDFSDPDMRDHSSESIAVSVQRKTGADPDCSASAAVPLSLTLPDLATAAATSETVSATFGSTALIDLPGGEASKQCDYVVTFPADSPSADGMLRYRLVGALAADLSGRDLTAAPPSSKVTRTYETLDAAVLDLRNVTTAGSADLTLSQRGVQVSVNPATSASADCVTAAPHGEYDSSDAMTFAALAAGAADDPAMANSSMRVELGAVSSGNCTFEVQFVNAERNCKVFAQLKDERGDVIGSAMENTAGSAITLTTKSTDKFKVFYDNNGTEETVGSIDFSVPDTDDTPAGACTDTTSTFDATITINVTDTDPNGDHDGTDFVVTIADGKGSSNSLAACTEGITDETLTLASKTDSVMVTGLRDDLYDGQSCSYTVTFTARETSATETALVLVGRGSNTFTLTADSATATREYVAARNKSQLPKVALASTSDTGSTETASPYITQTSIPTFNVTFFDPDDDDTASMVTGSTLTVTATTGTAPDITTVSRRITTDPDNAVSSATVEFTDAMDCTRNGVERQSCSLEDAEWMITATNTDPDANSGQTVYAPTTSDAIKVKVDNAAPVVTISTSATPDDTMVPAGGTVTVTFKFGDAVSDAVGSTTTESVTGFGFDDITHSGSGGTLVAGSFPASGDTYTATFTAGNIVGSTYTIQVPAGSTIGVVDRANNQSEASSTFTLTVDEAEMSISVENTADSSHAGDNRFNLQVTFTGSTACQSDDLHNDSFTIAAGATANIPVPAIDCDWALTAATPDDTDDECVVDPATRTLTVADSASTATLSLDGGTNTVTGHISTNFEVSCNTYFDATVSVNLVDADSADHSSRSITADLGRTGGPATGCSTAPTTVTVSLGTASSPSGVTHSETLENDTKLDRCAQGRDHLVRIHRDLPVGGRLHCWRHPQSGGPGCRDGCFEGRLDYGDAHLRSAARSHRHAQQHHRDHHEPQPH